MFHEVAPGIALDNFQTMQEAVEKNTFSQRLGLYLVGSFAGLAIAMVIAGLYGVLSQLVSYRRREIGVRMALGATRRSVAQLILKQGSILIGAGTRRGRAFRPCCDTLGHGFPVPGATAGRAHLCRCSRDSVGNRSSCSFSTGAQSILN